MIGLLDLPEEIVANIVGNLYANDFEKTVLSCKTLYRVLEPRIASHNDLRRQWSRIEFGRRVVDGGHHNEVDYSCALQLIVRIAQKPVVAHYINHLDLERMSHNANAGRNDQEAGIFASGRPSDSAKKWLTEIAARSVHLQDLHISPEDWLDQVVYDIRQNNWDSISDWQSAFLLSLLPNLQSLVLPPRYLWTRFADGARSAEERVLQPCCGFVKACLTHQILEQDYGVGGPRERHGALSDVYKFINMLITRANDGALHSQPLSKLKTLGSETCRDMKDDRTALIPFMSLRSLRSVSSFVVSCGRPMNPDWLNLYQPLGANLEHFSLRGCSLDQRTADLFFRNMRNLSSASLQCSQHHGDVEEVKHTDDITSLVHSLEAAAGHTLEHLHLTSEIDSRLEWFGDEPISSMQGFCNLKDVELYTGFFYCLPLAGEVEISERNPQPVEARQNAADKHCYDGQPCHVPSLAILLANSVSTLQGITLHVGPRLTDRAAARGLIQGVTCHSETFPRLERVRLVFVVVGGEENEDGFEEKVRLFGQEMGLGNKSQDNGFEIVVEGSLDVLTEDHQMQVQHHALGLEFEGRWDELKGELVCESAAHYCS